MPLHASHYWQTFSITESAEETTKHYTQNAAFECDIQLLSIVQQNSAGQPRLSAKMHKNSSGDAIANVNFYAVRPEATRIRWNNAK